MKAANFSTFHIGLVFCESTEFPKLTCWSTDSNEERNTVPPQATVLITMRLTWTIFNFYHNCQDLKYLLRATGRLIVVNIG